MTTDEQPEEKPERTSHSTARKTVVGRARITSLIIENEAARRGLNPAWLAKATGQERSAISRRLHLIHPWTINDVAALSLSMGLPVDFLMGISPEGRAVYDRECS